jgi:hypothetical protein
VQALDLYPDDHGPQGVGHFCEVTRALSEIDPADGRGIRAVSIWLGAVRGNTICHRCGCALQLLEAAGPAARQIAAPVLEQLARSRLLMSDDFQLGKTLKAVGVSGAAAAYDVEIDRICEPVIWRPLRGMGKFSDMQFEVFCRRPAQEER